jgi:hypothetical protein
MFVDGRWLTLATIWLSLVAYSTSLLVATIWPLALRTRANPARLLWTAGCLAALVHVGLAFHMYHGWSHTAAYVDTARQTRETVGLNWGGGIFFNYAFVLLWIVDSLWWWMSPQQYQARPPWITALFHGFFLFMIFNATVVFGSGPARWWGLVICLWALLSLAWQTVRWRRRLR